MYLELLRMYLPSQSAESSSMPYVPSSIDVIAEVVSVFGPVAGPLPV